jgi:hypothetical protein
MESAACGGLSCALVFVFRENTGLHQFVLHRRLGRRSKLKPAPMPSEEISAAGFDEGFAGIARSCVYHDAIRAAYSDLPDWPAPFSFVSLANLTRIAQEK